MKKPLRLACIIGLFLIGLVLVLFLCGFGRNFLSVNSVQRIQLTTYGENGTTIELEPDDVRKMVSSYNLSRYAGEVTADRCEQTFAVRIELKDGSSIHFRDYEGCRMSVSQEEKGRFWIDNVALLITIRSLAKEKGLTLETVGCC